MKIRIRAKLFRKEHATQKPGPFENPDFGTADGQNPPPRPHPYQASHFLLPSWKENRRSRLGPFSASLCFHVLLAFGLVAVGESVPPIRAELIPEVQITTPADHAITWYQWSKELPPILPLEDSETPEGGWPAHRNPQRIVASDSEVQSNRQMIWSADPRIELQEDIAAPNVVAVIAAASKRSRFEMESAEQHQTRDVLPVSDPAPLIEAALEIPAQVDFRAQFIRLQPLRYKASRREFSRPGDDTLTVERSPDIESPTPGGLDVAQFHPAAPLRFRMNTPQPETPGPRALAAGRAPSVEVGPAAFPLQSALLPSTPKLRFRLPAHTARAPARSVLGRSSAGLFLDGRVGAPALGSGGTDFVVWAAQDRMAQLLGGHGPPRAGPQGGSTTGSGGGLLGKSFASGVEDRSDGAMGSQNASESGAASASSGGESGDRPGRNQAGSATLAAVGINPDPDAPIPGPGVRRRGRFSAGPDGGDGVGESLGTGKGPGGPAVVRVPGLSVTPPAPMVATFGQGGSMPEFGSGKAIAFNPDRTVAQPKGSLEARGVDSRPVKIGERLDILAKGLGRIHALNESFVQEGAFVRPPTKSLPKVYIGGIEAQVLSSGWSLEFTGVDEVSVIVPEGVNPGDEVAVWVELEGARSREDVTIAVADAGPP